MSEELNQTELVKEFLKTVKKFLPGWLKDNKSELKDVLSELEGHIWEKSEEIAAGQDVQPYHVQQAIQEMGNPRDIAAEYKKRGTPKLWISKELFPAYLKVFGIVAAIIVGFNIISFIIDAISTGLSWDLFDYLNSIWSAALGAFLVVTAIFVVLSMEGYLPDDFTTSRRRLQLKSIPPDEMEEKEKWIQKDTKKVKPPLKRGDLLAGGIVTMLIGIAMIAKVWELIPIVEDIGSQLTYYIQLSGIFTLAGGFINLIQSLLDLTNYFAQRILMIMHVIVDLMFIPFLVTLFVPAIMSVPAIASSMYYAEIQTGFTVVMWIAIVGTVISAISNISKIITLRAKFEEYYQHQEM